MAALFYPLNRNLAFEVVLPMLGVITEKRHTTLSRRRQHSISIQRAPAVNIFLSTYNELDRQAVRVSKN